MTRSDLKRGMLWSLFVHGTLLSLLLLGKLSLPGGGGGAFGFGKPKPAEHSEEKPPGLGENEITVEILPPPKKGDTTPGPSEEDGLTTKAPHAKDECPDFFGGIGITIGTGYRKGDDRAVVTWVDEVHPGYPAAKAGIQAMDELLNHAEIRGEIGTSVVVKTARDGKRIDYNVVRDKICTEKRPEAGRSEP